MDDSEDFEYVNERNIDSWLICTICQEPLKNPTQVECKHTFCHSCIEPWIRAGNGTCPTCRRHVSRLSEASITVKNRLGSLGVRCKRCGETRLARRNFDHHINNVCLGVQVACSASDMNCRWRGTRDRLNNHLQQCGFQQLKPRVNLLSMENAQLHEEFNDLQQQYRRLQAENEAQSE